MELEKLVSIVIPVYNVEKYIDKCIQSILKQTYKNIEIIFVDDGSTDKSGEICDLVAEKDERFLVVHKKNEGVSVARNTALKCCKGDYITFIDPDDWIEENFIFNLVNELEKNNVDSVCCTFIHTDGKKWLAGEPKEDIKKGKDIIQNIMEENWYTTVIWNKLFKRECIYREKDNFIEFEKNRTVGEDEKWLIDIFIDTNRTMKFINQKLYYWRIREASALHSVKNKITIQMLDEIKTKEEIVERFSIDKSARIYKLAAKSLYEKTFVVCKYAFDFGEWDVIKKCFPKMRYGRRIWLKKEFKQNMYSAIRRIYWEIRIYLKCKIYRMMGE